MIAFVLILMAALHPMRRGRNLAGDLLQCRAKPPELYLCLYSTSYSMRAEPPVRYPIKGYGVRGKETAELSVFTPTFTTRGQTHIRTVHIPKISAKFGLT